MIKAVVSDLSRVIIFAKDENYEGDLNPLYAEKSPEDTFKFDDWFCFNEELLEFYNELSDKYELYVYTSGTMQDDPVIQEKLKGIFKEILSAERMGNKKSNPESYRQVIDKIGVSANEALFIDDNEKNIKAAKEVGLIAIHFENNESLIEDVVEYLR